MMDEEMIRRWNEVVGPDDIIYHLGDFCMGKRPAPYYLERLNGEKHFVWGNHDSDQVRNLPHWASSQPYLEVKIDGKFIVMCHYSFRVWNKSHRGALNFYGHSHNSLPGYRDMSCDVGSDVFNLTPVQLPEILRKMRTFPERTVTDHHDG
jgi:calcineurin-like phosphoesterase family protein